MAGQSLARQVATFAPQVSPEFGDDFCQAEIFAQSLGLPQQSPIGAAGDPGQQLGESPARLAAVDPELFVIVDRLCEINRIE